MSLPGAQPCSCRVLHPVCTGRAPHFSRPGAPGGQRRELAPTAVLTETSIWERPADTHRPFPLLQLGFPPFCTRFLT